MCAKVLVVDDEPATVKLLELLLQRAGYEVFTALDGPTALKVIEAEHPDVVVMDVMMPGMSGEDVVREIRQRPAIANTPTLMLSARSQVESKVSGLRAGADDYVTKPANPDELVARVEALLARASRTPAGAGSKSGRIVLFVGAKGGVGTTVTAVNVGISLALRGLDTRIVDLHWQLATASQLLGLWPRSSLADVIQRPVEEIDNRLVHKSIMHHHSGLNLLAGHPGLKIDLHPTPDQLKAVVEQAAIDTEFLLLDAPRDAATLAAVAPMSDFVALVLTTEPEAVASAATLAHFLREAGVVAQSIGLVLVHHWPQPTDVSLDKIGERVGCDFVGAIQPGPDACRECARLGVPLVLRNQTELAASSLMRLATRLSQHHIAVSTFAPLDQKVHASIDDLRKMLVRN